LRSDAKVSAISSFLTIPYFFLTRVGIRAGHVSPPDQSPFRRPPFTLSLKDISYLGPSELSINFCAVSFCPKPIAWLKTLASPFSINVLFIVFFFSFSPSLLFKKNYFTDATSPLGKKTDGRGVFPPALRFQ